MKVTSGPEGYEKVLQFNVFLKGGNAARERSNIKYTVTEEDYPPSRARDPYYEKDPEYRRAPAPREFSPRSSGHGARTPKRNPEPTEDEERSPVFNRGPKESELSPEDIGEVKSFLNRIKSESGQSMSRRKEPRHDEDYGETMFKPRNRTKREDEGDYTDEKTPEGYRGSRRKVPESEPPYEPEEDMRRTKPDPRNEEPEPRYVPSRRSETKQETPPRDDGKYLEIYVKPKKGQEKLVYTHDGQPADIIHRFTPKKNYDRYQPNEVYEPNHSRKPDDESRENRDRYPRPELHHPAEQPARRYEPKYDERPNPPREDSRPNDHNHSQPREREETPENPRHRTPVYDPMTEEQLQRAYEKQNELLDSLQKDHKALRHLVDKLCQKIEDSPAPRSNNKAVRPYPEDDEADYEPERPRNVPDSRVYDEVPPKEAYYKHPAQPRRRSRTPQPEPKQPWNEGPYRNPRDARDSLSPAPRRKMPFDVDKTYGKTEWDMKEPYLKQYNRLSDSPGKPSGSKYASPREPITYSPARRAPKSGDEFCGLCDVYVDKERFRRDMGEATRPEARSPRRDSVDDKPVTYYVQGKILGKVDRPAYIRDLFKPSYVS